MVSYPRAPMQFLFGVCYGFWVKDYNILPRKELHRRVLVKPGGGMGQQLIGFGEFWVQGFIVRR